MDLFFRLLYSKKVGFLRADFDVTCDQTFFFYIFRQLQGSSFPRSPKKRAPDRRLIFQVDGKIFAYDCPRGHEYSTTWVTLMV